MRSPYQAPTLRERQRDLTRSRLYAEALAEFRRVGFARASVSNIATSAGVSRASFYFHFPTKEHVLLELQWRLEVELVERLRPCETLGDTLAALIAGTVDNETRVADPDLYRDMLGIYTRHPRDGDLGLGDQPFPLLIEIGRRFATAAQQGELRAGLDPAQATHLFLTSLFGYQVGTSASDDEMRDDLGVLVSLFVEPGSR
jgi:TetR/AcrR family transcriptional repressor of uid operon